jgi:hypothetical protein
MAKTRINGDVSFQRSECQIELFPLLLARGAEAPAEIFSGHILRLMPQYASFNITFWFH